MHFAAIQGYASIKRYLIHIVQTQRVPHAQLFWGPEGSASLPLAIAFIAYLNCQNRLEDNTCGQCSSCLKMKKLVHPDVKFVFPTSTTKHITGKDVISTNFLKTWRNFIYTHPYGHVSDWSYHLNSTSNQLSISKEEIRGIIQATSLKPFEGKYKIVLIWLPEFLHVAAANALLKVVEEPPSHTLFLFVSAQPDKILSTIRSRTQQIHVPAFTDEALSAMLAQQHPLDQKQLAQIILLADGNLNKAFKLVENMSESYFDHFKKWMRLCYAHNLTQLVTQAETFQGMSKTDQKNFLAYSLHMLREALIAHFTQPRLVRATHEEQAFTKNLRKTLTHQQLKDWITWLNQAYYYIERHINARILYLDLSLRIARTFNAQPRPLASPTPKISD